VLTRDDYSTEFWQGIARRILFRTGDLQIAQKASSWQNGPKGIMDYVFNCPGEQFLDFLEDIFSSDVFWRVGQDDARIVDELNELISVDNLPYHLTHLFVKLSTMGIATPFTPLHIRKSS
jgi:hypothetical protein